MKHSKDEATKKFLELDTDTKKYLWGVSQNKQKIIKLMENSLSHLIKAANLKKHEKELRSNQDPSQVPAAQVKKELSHVAEELHFLERELKKFHVAKESMLADDNPWPEPIAPEIPKPAKEKGRRKILIIEDESIIIKSISYFLLQENYIVLFSLNAEDGLKKAAAEKPDLVLLDIMMPGMNGYQVLARLKAKKATAHIPIIILSSLSRESDILQGLENGASDYLTKPFSPKVLLSKINKIFAAKNEHIHSSRND